jgi:hypothetical protein
LFVAVLSNIELSTSLLIVGFGLAAGVGGVCDVGVLFIELQLPMMITSRKIPKKKATICVRHPVFGFSFT